MAIAGPAVVAAGKRGHRPKPEAKINAGAEARVMTFFTRMVRLPGNDD
jgi:hypothetical protein